MNGSLSRILCAAFLPAVLAAPAGLAAPQGPEPKPAPPAQEGPWYQPISPENYVDEEGIWIRPWPIPVCWEEDARNFSGEKRWVEQAIAEHLEDVSSIEFAGRRVAPRRWPDCVPDSLGIRISVRDERPESDVGQQWRRGPNRERQEELPTRMILNFALGGGFRSTCRGRREFCVKVIAVHEFLHAIGFLHEHLRADAPEDCRRQFGHQPDFPGYRPVQLSAAYDPSSMTNYCVSLYRRAIRLSEYDIQAIEYYYAQP